MGRTPIHALFKAEIRGECVFMVAHGKLVTVMKTGSQTQTHTLASDGPVRTIAISADASRVAIAADARTLSVFDTHTWAQHAQILLPKRPTAVAFHGSDLVVADKFGDVHRLSVGGEKIKLLLGHCSFVTAMILDLDLGHVITSDRDEKIRISSFPDTFQIEGFCLGHTGFISAICKVPNRPREIVSGGGDGLLLFWNVSTVSETQRIVLAELAPELKTEPGKHPHSIIAIKACTISDSIAILFEGIPFVYILRVEKASNQYSLHTKLSLPFLSALDIEFDHSGDLVVALGPGSAFLVACAPLKKEGNEIQFGEISLDSGIATRINSMATSEESEPIDYSAYLEVLRKRTEEEVREKRGNSKRKGDDEETLGTETKGDGKKGRGGGGKKSKAGQ
ncbi:WD repeat-containing protein 4 [Chytriomyces hyalinus]|nr:WD repeat-containing protein 4 [Chytriomyces hyalinus]